MSNQNIKTVNFQNFNKDGSLKEVAGIILESSFVGSSEGKHGKCYTSQFRLKIEENVVSDMLDKVSVVRRDLDNKDEIINYRLFYNPKQIHEKIKLSKIIKDHLDDYETIWKVQFASFLKCYPTIVYDPIINLHPCFELKRDGFNDNTVIMVATMQDKIIGYMVANEDYEDGDHMTFLFKNNETCGNILFDYMQYTLVSVLEGGRQVNLRDIFTFTDDEIKEYIVEDGFIVCGQTLFQSHTGPINSTPIDNNLGIN